MLDNAEKIAKNNLIKIIFFLKISKVCFRSILFILFCIIVHETMQRLIVSANRYLSLHFFLLSLPFPNKVYSSATFNDKSFITFFISSIYLFYKNIISKKGSTSMNTFPSFVERYTVQYYTDCDGIWQDIAMFVDDNESSFLFYFSLYFYKLFFPSLLDG